MKMFHNIILKIFKERFIILFICFLVIVLRNIYLIKIKHKFTLYKEVFNLMFIIYIIFLLGAVTFKDVSWSSSNFIPFKEIFRYQFGTKLFFKNVIGNILLFIPYGFFISYFFKTNIFFVFILTLFTSLTIECIQCVIGRVFDIDDILLNIIGGLLGFLSYYFLFKLKAKLSKLLKRK